jgi:mannosyltransferase
MTIIFDNIIYSLQKSGGISVVWTELLKGIIKSGLNYICREYGDAMSNIFRRTIPIPTGKILFVNCSLLSVQRYINPVIDKNEPFIFHSSYYRFCKNKNAVNITTVHDFVYEYYSSGFRKWLHRWQKYRAIKHSDYIICISDTTKNDLLKFVHRIDETKIKVIYNGVSDDYFPLQKPLTDNQYGNFALFIGSRAGYKNFYLSVQAVKGTKLNLVIVGSALTKSENHYLQKELGTNRYFSLGRITNNELNSLYNKAICLMYLSLYEGFGLPVIEAQRAGCPVITVNAPSVVEILGDVTSLIAEPSVESVREKILMLEDNKFRDTVINAGLKNASRFSWGTMREQYLQLYRQIYAHFNHHCLL